MTQRDAPDGAGRPPKDHPVDVEVTCPDAASARRIARAALQGGLVACANILPGVESLFRWQGRIESEAEVLLRLKTRLGAFDALAELIMRLHPYDQPAIVALPLRALGPGVEDWLRDSISARADEKEKGAGD